MSTSETPRIQKYIYYSSNSSKKEAIHSVDAYTAHEATEYFALIKNLSYSDFLNLYTVEEAS